MSKKHTRNKLKAPIYARGQILDRPEGKNLELMTIVDLLATQSTWLYKCLCLDGKLRWYSESKILGGRP